MPTLEQQVYPVLKNPFNRSATSLAHGAVPTRDRPSIHASPTQFRPSTPNSSDFKFRGTPTSKHRGHSYAKSQHSHSGSIFHFSDGGSDHGHGFSFGAPFTPPPVPPVPNPFGIPMPLSESPDLEEEKVIVEARTPSEFALHAIFIRFAASAESLMSDFVGRPLVRVTPDLDCWTRLTLDIIPSFVYRNANHAWKLSWAPEWTPSLTMFSSLWVKSQKNTPNLSSTPSCVGGNSSMSPSGANSNALSPVSQKLLGFRDQRAFQLNESRWRRYTSCAGHLSPQLSQCQRIRYPKPLVIA